MGQRPIFDGAPTSTSRLWTSGLALIGGGALWLFAFLLLPMVVLAVLAFAQRDEYGEIIWVLTTDNIWRVLGHSSLGWTADNLRIIVRSVEVAGATTLMCLLIGLPLAFWMAGRPRHERALWMALIMVPTCINLVIRTYAWMLMFGNNLPPAWMAQWLGILLPGEGLYPSGFAVYIGMISCMLPFTVLPLYTSVERLDWNIVEAARDLYAGPWRTFRHGVLSQIMPGVVAAVVLTAVPSLGMYVVSDLLGGAKFMLIGNYMQVQMTGSSDPPMAAMVGLALIIVCLVGLAAMYRFGGKASGSPL